MVEEDERADHATLRERQNAPDLEPTQVAPPLLDHQFDHVRTPGRVVETKIKNLATDDTG
jgi:hypothetical protein